MNKIYDILKDEEIKKTLDNFKPKKIDDKQPLRVELGAILINKIQESLMKKGK